MIGLLAKPWPMQSVSGYAIINAVNTPPLASFPASNLANNDFGRVAKFPNMAAGSYAVFQTDLGSAKSVDVVALLWSSLTADDQIRVEGSNDNFNSVSYSSGNMSAVTGSTYRDVPGPAKFLFTLPAAQTFRYWQVVITVSGNRSVSASRLFVGKGAKFVVGAQKATLGAKDMNVSVQTEVGETRQQEEASLIRPVVALSFEYTKQSEMEQVLGQYTLGLGTSKPLLICTDLTTPYLQDNVAFGRPEKVVTLDSTIYDAWSFEAVVTSIGP